MTILVTRRSRDGLGAASIDGSDRRRPVAWRSLAISPAVRIRPTGTQRGFTLVELMIVVVIVGVLAVLGVVGFQKLIGTSRTTEATQMIKSIGVAQEAFHAETGTYADISSTLCNGASSSCASFYPHASEGTQTVGSFKASWGAPCTTGCNTNPVQMDWLMLNVHAEGNVMYGYSTIAGVAGATTSQYGAQGFPSSLGAGSGAISSITWSTSPPADWYIVTAVGNAEDNVNPCVVMGTSFQSDLVVVNEGN
jgi:type IV pilus assembly protein PilA